MNMDDNVAMIKANYDDDLRTVMANYEAHMRELRHCLTSIMATLAEVQTLLASMIQHSHMQGPS
jgi:hypothetical protein